MEITNFIKIKGIRYPVIDLPISVNEFHELKEKYERFIVHDVRRGVLRFHQGGALYKKNIINIDFKSSVYIAVSMFSLYRLYKVKKAIGKVREQVKNGINHPKYDIWEEIDNYKSKVEEEDTRNAEA